MPTFPVPKAIATIAMILEVKIKAPAGGASRTLRFSKSPIRIGRNQLNDISLDDPFVSEWHGTIRFDERSVAYFDLGSTNGTLLDGKRMAKNVASELSDSSRLQLGLLEIVVARPLVEPDPVARPAGTGPHKTLAWGRADVVPGAPLVIGQSGPIHTPLSGAFTPPPGAVTSPPMNATPPPPASRGADRVRDADDAAVAAGKAKPRQDGEASQAALQRKLLEAFCEAFIGLRKGYEQFGAEVGVRTINGATPLHRVRSSRELLDYLNQPNVDTTAAARDLIAIFADFGIHHIAMMQGVTEGVRALLRSLNPQATDSKGRLFAKAKPKDQWKAYQERLDQMLTDDNELHDAIFGNHFARAYASVTLGDAGKAPDDDGE